MALISTKAIISSKFVVKEFSSTFPYVPSLDFQIQYCVRERQHEPADARENKNNRMFSDGMVTWMLYTNLLVYTSSPVQPRDSKGMREKLE